MGHFHNLFTSSLPTFGGEIDELIQLSISKAKNVALCALLSVEEIKGHVFQLRALKALGPDGMSTLFFHHTVGKALIDMVQHFFSDRAFA